MLAGPRDEHAHSTAEALTRAAEEMRKRSTHLETVKEVDLTEVERLRADFIEVATALAQENAGLRSEVDALKQVLIAIGHAADKELKRS